jgi:hypothetical protein
MLSKCEIKVADKAALESQVDNKFQELSQLELAIVGGGIAETIL